MNRWNEGNYYQKGGCFQMNKNDYNNNSYYNNRESNYMRQRRRWNQSGGD